MRRLPILDLLVKVALVLLLVSALLVPDLSGVKEKAGTARLVVYPLGLLAVPLWWWAWGRRRAARTGRPGFPWSADLLVSLPWLLDTLGNRLDLFDSVSWWDDGMHFLNWALLTGGVLLAWAPRGVPRGLVVLAGLAFGMAAALLWELGEYATFLRTSPELQTAYTDTLGDLSLGSLGALVAGLVVAWTRPRAEAAAPVRESAGARPT
ncbi:hypothetical protein SAMN04488543_3117 [Friedmanniella luteola]|uniref:Uncharacterized protein n=1 Tax=Friedmanniella luteola TaxID=546871 RepID=A0A1H1XVN6_9ACTN|nr:hypothetical protein [Friedmanniella luteola]SDT13262.1 hypothetical protein SAMN04488543_3117 [Friedmanniella luteola]